MTDMSWWCGAKRLLSVPKCTVHVYGRSQRTGFHSLLWKKRITGATAVKSLSHSKLPLVVHMSRPFGYKADENGRIREERFRGIHCWMHGLNLFWSGAATARGDA